VLKQVFIAMLILASVIAVGQVPQTGVVLSDSAESVLKSLGSKVIFVTHQTDISGNKSPIAVSIYNVLGKEVLSLKNTNNIKHKVT